MSGCREQLPTIVKMKTLTVQAAMREVRWRDFITTLSRRPVRMLTSYGNSPLVTSSVSSVGLVTVVFAGSAAEYPPRLKRALIVA